MKNFKISNLFIFAVILIFNACSEPESGLEQETSSFSGVNNESSLVDPNTPLDTRPNISEKTHFFRVGSTPDGNGADIEGAAVEWKCVWSDEFAGNSLSTNKWTYSDEDDRPVGSGVSKNNIYKWYWRKENVSVNNGKLILEARKVDNSTLSVGSVETRSKHMFRYGFYETKVKIAEVNKGSHTSFWLQSTGTHNIDSSGADGAEIDVFESVYANGEECRFAIHYDGYVGSDKRSYEVKYKTRGVHSGFHTFGLHWTPDKLDIYYDGQRVKNTSNKTFSIKTHGGNDVVPKVPEWLWLSNGAAFKPTDFEYQNHGLLDTSEFEYVRVFKLKPKENVYFRIYNKKAKTRIKTYGPADNSYIRQTKDSYGDWTIWKVKKSAGKYYYIVNQGTGKYIRPVSNSNNSRIQLKPTSYTGSWTQWEFIDAGGDGYFYIKNKETGKYLRPESMNDTANTIIASGHNNNDWFKWKVAKI